MNQKSIALGTRPNGPFTPLSKMKSVLQRMAAVVQSKLGSEVPDGGFDEEWATSKSESAEVVGGLTEARSPR